MAHPVDVHSPQEALAALLNAAVDAGGDAENAASTCLLEHARQVKVDRVLRPWLSQAARAQWG